MAFAFAVLAAMFDAGAFAAGLLADIAFEAVFEAVLAAFETALAAV